MVFENRVMRIFGPRRDEVAGEWRRLQKKELYALYSSANSIPVIKSRRLRWAGHVARTRDCRVGYKVLVGKPEVRRQLGRPRRRWDDDDDDDDDNNNNNNTGLGARTGSIWLRIGTGGGIL